jgi:lipopolysaccharide/colanic/teichoic acid biosynthesis glycosyltransferase
LRKSKLDELPQLFNVLEGEMSLVGPRPNLFSQVELVEFRTAQNVYTVRPGITGEAQIKNIDMSNPELLAKTDANMISQMNLLLYFKLIVLTVIGRGGGDPIQSAE